MLKISFPKVCLSVAVLFLGSLFAFAGSRTMSVNASGYNSASDGMDLSVPAGACYTWYYYAEGPASVNLLLSGAGVMVEYYGATGSNSGSGHYCEAGWVTGRLHAQSMGGYATSSVTINW